MGIPLGPSSISCKSFFHTTRSCISSKVILNFSNEGDLMISCDTFLIVPMIKHWDLLLITQHFPACIYTSTTCKTNSFLQVWQSPFFSLENVLWSAVEFKVPCKLFCFFSHQSAFSLVSAMENRSMALEFARLWLPRPRHAVVMRFFIENCIQRWWADAYKFLKISLRLQLGFVPSLI